MKYFKILGGLAMIIILIAYLNRDKANNSLACAKAQEFNREQYSGITIEKYIDQKNHRVKTIKINTGSSTFNIVLARDTSSLYDYITTGDSLIKIKDVTYLDVYRQDRVKRFYIWFGCN